MSAELSVLWRGAWHEVSYLSTTSVSTRCNWGLWRDRGVIRPLEMEAEEGWLERQLEVIADRVGTEHVSCLWYLTYSWSRGVRWP